MEFNLNRNRYNAKQMRGLFLRLNIWNLLISFEINRVLTCLNFDNLKFSLFLHKVDQAKRDCNTCQWDKSIPAGLHPTRSNLNHFEWITTEELYVSIGFSWVSVEIKSTSGKKAVYSLFGELNCQNKSGLHVRSKHLRSMWCSTFCCSDLTGYLELPYLYFMRACVCA